MGGCAGIDSKGDRLYGSNSLIEQIIRLKYSTSQIQQNKETEIKKQE
jgi:hypothetical protein